MGRVSSVLSWPGGRSLIVSGAHAGCFASDAASLGAQESEEIEEELNVPHMSRRVGSGTLAARSCFVGSIDRASFGSQ